MFRATSAFCSQIAILYVLDAQRTEICMLYIPYIAVVCSHFSSVCWLKCLVLSFPQSLWMSFSLPVCLWRVLSCSIFSHFSISSPLPSTSLGLFFYSSLSLSISSLCLCLWLLWVIIRVEGYGNLVQQAETGVSSTPQSLCIFNQH